MNRKGYGFHSFLINYIRNNNVTKILEIGVANGENALNMIEAALDNQINKSIYYFGFDKFVDWDREQVESKLSESGVNVRLFKGDSKVTLPSVVNELPNIDLVFIDGGHNIETTKSDWKYTKKLINESSVVFFHNYDFKGPKHVVDNIYRDRFSVEILDPENDYRTAKVFLS
ncbi:MAG: putative O-methyltransferase YrrM [Candidatus Methanohalarchaeum thermophilum]|uniref:O-methyltransferase YrrM n=1 Tax=Methanohalarchaeum thermophilum TaxID=1903181 RepID=A0A1Q6DUA0_METT1|nr:MAG: putative O-methyltransferase YrrM [Candidatus Methanohalarchaeum thermophilum]